MVIISNLHMEKWTFSQVKMYFKESNIEKGKTREMVLLLRIQPGIYQGILKAMKEKGFYIWELTSISTWNELFSTRNLLKHNNIYQYLEKIGRVLYRDM